MQRVEKYTEEIFKSGYIDYQGNDIFIKRRYDNVKIIWFISHYGLGAAVPTWSSTISYNLGGYENLEPENFENVYQKMYVHRQKKLERICK